MAELPLEVFFDGEVDRSVVRDNLGAFYRYFDLCNEQAFLHDKHRISETTWKEWCEGITSNMRRSAFRTAWFELIKPRVSEDFREFSETLDELESSRPRHVLRSEQPAVQPAATP